jgi:predicted DNA-binding transcriptional regulator AlpA
MITKETKARDTLLAQEQTEWLSPQGVSRVYGFSTSTLAKWRMDNKNLPFSKMGKYIRYKRSDIEAFIESNKVEVAS